jgi:hypothetical protein
VSLEKSAHTTHNNARTGGGRGLALYAFQALLRRERGLLLAASELLGALKHRRGRAGVLRFIEKQVSKRAKLASMIAAADEQTSGAAKKTAERRTGKVTDGTAKHTLMPQALLTSASLVWCLDGEPGDLGSRLTSASTITTGPTDEALDVGRDPC